MLKTHIWHHSTSTLTSIYFDTITYKGNTYFRDWQFFGFSYFLYHNDVPRKFSASWTLNTCSFKKNKSDLLNLQSLINGSWLIPPTQTRKTVTLWSQWIETMKAHEIHTFKNGWVIIFSYKAVSLGSRARQVVLKDFCFASQLHWSVLL